MKFLSLLDGFFFINLCLLASATLYSEVSNGNRSITVSISTAVTFAVFCSTVLYHAMKIIRMFCAKKGLLATSNMAIEQPLVERDSNFGSSDSEDSDNALLKFIDVERELPDVTLKHRPTTTTINIDTY